MTLSQANRMIRIATPLGEDAFVVLSFSGTEQVSGLFTYHLTLASERSDITFAQLAGKNVTAAIKSADGPDRFFNGIITGFAPGQGSLKEGLNAYTAVVRPTVWLLTQCADCRVFQDQNVPDIIAAVLRSAPTKGVRQTIDFRMALAGCYSSREICIQYNETDLAFIERLCETEGIFYFFEHDNGQHTLVFADTPDNHPLCPGAEIAGFQNSIGGVEAKERISCLQPDNKLMTGQFIARDYNFTLPNVDMTVQCSTNNSQPASPGAIYEYPGGYQKPTGQGDDLAALRMAASDARMHTLNGKSNCRGFASGFKFTLQAHPMAAIDKQHYVLRRVQHEARQHLAPGTGGDSYMNLFSCLPYAIAFRPARNHPKPFIGSSQTAVVTGPADEEIHTDRHGRVKVKFHWDRRADAQSDGNLSCWIRVSQIFTGAKYGALYIPRVGQEVVVSFLDGDPDRPIIIGRVYNSHNMPPYDLPAEKTKSTLKTSSSKKGQGNFNEIRFEDLTGQEEFFTHAAKDQNEVVQNDMSTQVKNNQRIDVQNNRAVTVIDGSERIAIQSGGRQVAVQADETHTNAANFTQKVSGTFKLKVNGDVIIDASGNVVINGAKIILNG